MQVNITRIPKTPLRDVLTHSVIVLGDTPYIVLDKNAALKMAQLAIDCNGAVLTFNLKNCELEWEYVFTNYRQGKITDSYINVEVKE